MSFLDVWQHPSGTRVALYAKLGARHGRLLRLRLDGSVRRDEPIHAGDHETLWAAADERLRAEGYSLTRPVRVEGYTTSSEGVY